VHLLPSALIVGCQLMVCEMLMQQHWQPLHQGAC
jgi:hypothetical protein